MKWSAFSLVVFILLGPADDSTAQQPSERKPIVVSPVQEVAWGERALKSFLKDRPSSSDGQLGLRVDQIGRRVARFSDRPQVHYRFMVVTGEELQAFSFPGGTVCLTEKLARLHSSDDELAFTLGHELSHIVLRHHISRLRVQELFGAGASIEDVLLEAVRSRFDRDLEMEADRFGALYAVRAGYRYTATYQTLETIGSVTRGPLEDRSHGSFEERVAELKRFREELQRSLDAFDRGVVALGGKDPEEAITALNLFVGEFPNSVAGRVNLGAAYLARIRRSAGTPEGLSEILPILPEPDVRVRGSYDVVDLYRARENFEQALGIRSDEVMAEAGLGLVLARLGDFKKAREHLDKARSLAPRNPELCLCRGNVEYLAGEYEAAVPLYMRAVVLRPDWPEANKNLALTYEALGKLGLAREIWEKLVDDKHLGPEAQRHLEDLSSKRD